MNGFCIPDDKGACSSGYPTVPEPDNSCGWSCSTMGWGETSFVAFVAFCLLQVLVPGSVCLNISCCGWSCSTMGWSELGTNQKINT